LYFSKKLRGCENRAAFHANLTGRHHLFRDSLLLVAHAPRVAAAAR
jgi:hypothetical protein